MSSANMSVEELRELGNEKFRALNYGGALMHYTQAIDKDPNSFAIYYNRAVTLVKMDAIKEAKEDLLKSLEINPDYIPSLCQLAFIYLYQGNTPDSLETYVKVIKLNQSLPNQMNRFKAQLKEAIRLTESRCKQQEYSQEFIDEIITPDIRTIIDSYPNLPTHMIESGIPPVAFGNVPISHSFHSPTAVVTGASIPISLSNITAAATTRASGNRTTNTNGDNINTNNNNTNPSVGLNLPGLLNSIGTPGVTGSISIGGPQSAQELMNMLGGLTNPQENRNQTTGDTTSASVNASTNIDSNNHTTSSSSSPPQTQTQTQTQAQAHTIIHPPITHSNTNLPEDIMQRHRDAHQAALNRATELRRQREAEVHQLQQQHQEQVQQSQQQQQHTTVSLASPTTSATTSATTSSGFQPVSDAQSNNTQDTTHATSTTISPGADFARNLTNTLITQLGNAAIQNASQVGSNATPNEGAIQNLARNITNIASNVIGGFTNDNNFVTLSNNSNNETATTPLDADLEMDLD